MKRSEALKVMSHDQQFPELKLWLMDNLEVLGLITFEKEKTLPQRIADKIDGVSSQKIAEIIEELIREGRFVQR